MNECLVTRLKTSVVDDSLTMYDALRIEVFKQSVDTKNNCLYIASGTIGSGVDVVSFTHPFYINGVAYYNYHINGRVKIVFANEDYSVYIKNKNNIANIDGVAENVSDGKFRFNLDELKYNNVLSTLILKRPASVYGTLKVNSSIVTNINMNTDVNNPNLVKVDLADFNNSTKLTNLGLSYQDVTGSILNLAKNIALTNVAFGDKFSTTEIKNFAKAQVSAGRTSGSIQLLMTLVYDGITNPNARIEYSSEYDEGYRIVGM